MTGSATSRSSGRHVCVLDPAVRTPELDCFNRIALHSPLPATYHLPALHGMDSVKRREPGLAGIIILGSASSVHESRPWQKELVDWLLPRLEAKVPTLGLCFGHQLIAHCFGAMVDTLYTDNRKLTGLREVALSACPLWGDRPLSGRLVVSHREAVVGCPSGFRVVGQSPEVSVEALAHERLPIWTFQAHPEATQAFALRQGISLAGESDLAFGHSIVQAFLDRIATH